MRQMRKKAPWRSGLENLSTVVTWRWKLLVFTMWMKMIFVCSRIFQALWFCGVLLFRPVCCDSLLLEIEAPKILWNMIQHRSVTTCMHPSKRKIIQTVPLNWSSSPVVCCEHIWLRGTKFVCRFIQPGAARQWPQFRNPENWKLLNPLCVCTNYSV